LDNLGFSVTTLLAGLGVGGIAVSLVAQRTFEDMFGAAIRLLTSRLRIGDFSRFSSMLGTVEEIGLANNLHPHAG
jgi:MscS family membrane protein